MLIQLKPRPCGDLAALSFLSVQNKTLLLCASAQLHTLAFLVIWPA